MFVVLVEKELLKKLYDFLFSQKLTFEICFPNDGEDNCDNPLLYGKKEICNMDNIHIEEWDGMEGAIKVAGVLTDEVKQVFYKALSERGIWRYAFYRGGKQIVEVYDFDDIILRLQDDEVEKLREQGIVD